MTNSISSLLMIVLLWASVGCNFIRGKVELPQKRQLVREQLVIHSDFYLPQSHRLIEELASLRYEISKTLELPLSDEPIEVYLFENERKFRNFMARKMPQFPHRRAFFIKNDTRLMVLTFWGELVAEDLRHEVTHGYLHAVTAELPHWLDEGIAEYFEVRGGETKINEPHVRLLADAFRKKNWRPNLEVLEAISATADLTQREYAESWLWVHFLLTSDAHSNGLVCQTLKQWRETGAAPPLSHQVAQWLPNWEQELIGHLRELAEKL